ncbi:phosphoribosyl transferase domain protein [Hydrogenophaga sp. RAC07]|uniref:phosphoribosyltransferase n=1 Tax=Hydrogenophaga sp. RAC07 TaxID=1842537 RepID=UPI0008571732|nr:phosphoribosyltransferase [Hydrogenophaga sp. RAC07]AOF83947.1 phosphoribosyl transferase domain protein [Hydrogenophaga sp. RAC07]
MNALWWTDSDLPLRSRGCALLYPGATMPRAPFENRTQAGRELADALRAMGPTGPLVVLALPRGGVPVAAEVARALNAPLDLLLVRKIGAPFEPELAVAAVVEGTPPDVVRNEEISNLPGVDEAWIEANLPVALSEIERRRGVYMGGRPPQPVAGATVIVVDDGIATGTTMKAALRALRRRQPARLIVAVPVGPHATIAELSDEVDEVICLQEPRPFRAIGLHYLDFHQLSDDEVCAALTPFRPVVQARRQS